MECSLFSYSYRFLCTVCLQFHLEKKTNSIVNNKAVTRESQEQTFCHLLQVCKIFPIPQSEPFAYVSWKLPVAVCIM